MVDSEMLHSDRHRTQMHTPKAFPENDFPWNLNDFRELKNDG